MWPGAATGRAPARTDTHRAEIGVIPSPDPGRRSQSRKTTKVTVVRSCPIVRRSEKFIGNAKRPCDASGLAVAIERATSGPTTVDQVGGRLAGATTEGEDADAVY